MLLDWIEARAEAAPEAAALEFEGDAISYERLIADAGRIAGLLARDYGVGVGDRVAYLGLNHPDVIRLTLACHWLGAIFNPLNSRLAKEEYRQLLEDGEPSVCFLDPDFAHLSGELQGVASFETSAALRGMARAPGRAAVGADAPLLLVYTSGTTGRPKGVVLSRDAVSANIESSQSLYDIGPGDRIFINLPLFHVGGLCILLLPTLAGGGTVVLHRRFDPAETMEALTDTRLTGSILVPAQMNALIGGPGWAEADFSHLSYLVVGSSVIPLTQIQAWHAKGPPVSQVYGATETGPDAIGMPLEMAKAYEGAAGVALPGVAIRIVDPDGEDRPDGTPGEVLVKGRNVMSRYWRNPEQTATVLQDGWYRTGDAGLRDENGVYWIVDRLKDVIISGGENIYPAEVEIASGAHPAIEAIAVVGRPDPKWGETPVAVVELAEGADLTLADYHDFLADRVARYKQPKDIVAIDALPRNSLGKVDKGKLRKMVAERADG